MSQKKQKQSSQVNFYPQKLQKRPMNIKLFIGMKEKCLTKMWFSRNGKPMSESNKNQSRKFKLRFKQKNLKNYLLFHLCKLLYNDASNDYTITLYISEVIQSILPDVMLFYIIVGLCFLLAIINSIDDR